jgi:hypothetical protein
VFASFAFPSAPGTPDGSTPGFANPLELQPQIVRLVLAAAGLSTILIARRYLAGGASSGDDNSSHLAEILFVARCLRSGTLDFWFDQNLLGYPLFLAYQPAPSLLMGGLVALTEGFLSPFFLYKVSMVLLWGGMPACWYLGGRWLGLERGTALAFGLLLLAARDTWDFGIGFNSAAHYGLYTQAWATAILPPTIGSLYRYACRKDLNPFVPVSLLTFTFLSHLIFGYLCLLASVLLVFNSWSEIGRRAARLGLVAAGTLALIGFWLIPFLLHSRYQGGFPYRWSSSDGFPLSETLFRAARGDLLDGGRVPWLTGLALIGVGDVLFFRRDPAARWMLALGAVAFLMLLGPAGWGDWYRRLPLHEEFQVIRYLAGVQLAALFLAARGVRTVLLLLSRGLDRAATRNRLPVPAAVINVLMAVGAAALLWTWLAAANGSWRTFDHGSRSFSELTTFLSRGSGRFLCHERLGTADHYHYNLLPLLAGRPHVRTYGRGYHDTLSLYYLDHVQFSPLDFRLYNIHHVVARADVSVDPELLRPVWSNDAYRVFQVADPGGYFEFVRVPLSLHGKNPKLFRDLLLDIDSTLFGNGALPAFEPGPAGALDRIEWRGPNSFDFVVQGLPVAREAPASRIKDEVLRRYPREASGRSSVIRESASPNQYRARVVVQEDGMSVLLKASYHPLWSVTVDGQQSRVLHLAPNLMAVEVPRGEHDVQFQYRNPTSQKTGLLLSVLAWGSWGAGILYARRRSREPGAKA